MKNKLKLKKPFFRRYLMIGIITLAVLSICVLLWSSGLNTNEQQTNESNFSWDIANGQEIEVYLSQHPYSEAIISRLPDFQEKTGIKVNYNIIPEEYYFDKLTTNIRSFRSPDVFMTGPYYIWSHASKGYIHDLDFMLKQPDVTDPNFDIDDFYPTVINAFKWDGYPGHEMGSGGLWGIPLGFEVFSLAYNNRIFRENGLKPPVTMEELLELCKKLREFNGKGTYALAVRGAVNWATINTGYITTYANYGAKDFDVVDGRLVSRVNSPEAVEMTDMWIQLLKAGGTPEGWENYSWYDATADFGAGRAAMLLDADIVGYYQNYEGESGESGNISWIKAPLPKGRSVSQSNLWTWGLGISSYSKNKTAAWLFIQYFTARDYSLWAAENYKAVNPARKSVLESPSFRELVKNAEGYAEVLYETIPNAELQFTPHPYFYKMSELWSKTIQDIYFGRYESTKEGLDELKTKIDEMVKDLVIK